MKENVTSVKFNKANISKNKKIYAQFSVNCPFCNKKYPYKVLDEEITYNDLQLVLRRKHKCSKYNKFFYTDYILYYDKDYEVLVNDEDYDFYVKINS